MGRTRPGASLGEVEVGPVVDLNSHGINTCGFTIFGWFPCGLTGRQCVLQCDIASDCPGLR